MLINWGSVKRRNIVLQRYGANRVYQGAAVVSVSPFTPDFILAATSDLRCPKAMVEVTWAKSSIDENQVITSNDINRIDRTGQLFNGEG